MSDRRKPGDGNADRRNEDGAEPMPAAGPHSKPELTNPEATPGAGSLPSDKTGGEADGGAG